MTYLEWKENYRLERLKRNEIWKEIPNYEGLYQVSNLGNVRSLDKTIIKGNGVVLKIKGKKLKTYLNKKGYYTITISKEGRLKSFLIHLLVAYSFLNHIPSGLTYVVDHIDDNPLNNFADNLQIITQRKNTSKDRFRFDYSSKKIGVSWCKQTSKWRASIYLNGKNKHLGRYNSEKEASEAYQNALKLHC